MSITDFPKKFAIALITLYQRTLSPDHSWLRGRFPYGYCKFYPSCSDYAKQAIEKFGLMRGAILAAKRISHCHPWSEPKVDPVPQKFTI